MMHMSFWFGYADIQMIFAPWIINDIPKLIGSCAGLFMISIIYECLKTYRDVKTDQLNKEFDAMIDSTDSFTDSRSGLDQPIDRSDSDQELIDSGNARSQASVLINPTHILLRDLD